MPVIAVVGRPNVGKSTLFNRLIRQRKAIVHDQPGLTRDRHYGTGQHLNRPFVVIDTGGYEDTTNSPMLKLMREQTLIAIDEADAILFVTEQGVPSDPIDAEIIDRLRASGKPFFLTVNKADDEKRCNQAIADFSTYGLDMVYPVSALHGDGVYDLMDEVVEDFEEFDPDEADEDGPIRVALVGRQNVGKSTLTNLLLGKNRVIASNIAGTTRDAIDSELTVHGQDYVLIDTAGIRRRGKIERGAEKLSVHSSFNAIDRSQVVLLMVDIAEGITAQDTHIAGYALERGRACIIVLNKWDKVTDRDQYGDYIKKVREEFNFMKWAPILTISARTGQRTHKIWELIQHCSEQFRRQFKTAELNGILDRATSYLSPPIVKGRPLRFKYVTQVSTAPPVFAFFVNDPKLVHFSYERFLANQYRRTLELEGTPLFFKYRSKSGNWEDHVRDRQKKKEEAVEYTPVAVEIDWSEEDENDYLAGLYGDVESGDEEE